MHGTRERDTGSVGRRAVDCDYSKQHLWEYVTILYVWIYFFFFFLGMKQGQFGGAAEVFGGALPPCAHA